MKTVLFLLSLAAVQPFAQAIDFESEHFYETENAYYFETATMSGMLPTYLPKKDVRIEEKGLDDRGRVQMEASLFFRTPGLPEFDQASKAIPAWKDKPFDFYPSYVAENCTFNREIDGEIKATSPFPTRKGTTVSSFGVKFCRFGVLFKDSQKNRVILEKAAADQTLIASGLEKHRVILKNAQIPTPIDAKAIHRLLAVGIGANTKPITQSHALFLAGAAVAKLHDQKVIAALTEPRVGAISQLLAMLFVAGDGGYLLKPEAPTGENPVVMVRGSKVISLDI